MNTANYWEGNLGAFAIPAFLLLLLCFLVLGVLLLRQAFLSAREKFRDKERLLLIALLAIVLTTTFLFPRGLIDFEKFQGEDLLIAQREGVANCMTTLKLKDNHRFVERNVCFGIAETTGQYRIAGDTVYFENVSHGRDQTAYFEFAIIRDNDEKKEFLGELTRFRDRADKIGMPLPIVKNELK